MPYRRIELISTGIDTEQLNRLLDDAEAIDRYEALVQGEGPGRHVFIVDEKHTETVIDAIQDRYGDTEGFRLMIYEISGLLPMPTDAAGDVTDKPEGRPNRRVTREELLDDLEPGSHVTAVYVGQVLISCVVASVGMIYGNVAMVIAAMVIAPLLLPNMSLALGTMLGDVTMMRRSAVTTLVGLAAGLGLALLIGLIFRFDPAAHEIAIRARVRFADLAVALAAGAAGALAVTTAVSANLVGVMVAVALMPPLVALGLLLGAGELDAAGGAATLLMINLVCVNLAAVGVFLLQGIRPHTWYQVEQARRATRIAILVWVILLIGLALLIWLAAPGGSVDSASA